MSSTEWTDKFPRQIEKSLTFTDETYLMDDFNIDIKDEQLCNTNWKYAKELIDLKQLIKEPFIDHFYTSKGTSRQRSKPGLVVVL